MRPSRASDQYAGALKKRLASCWGTHAWPVRIRPERSAFLQQFTQQPGNTRIPPRRFDTRPPRDMPSRVTVTLRSWDLVDTKTV